MNYFSHAFQKMFVPKVGTTLVTSTSSSTDKLTAGELGIFNSKTFKGFGTPGSTNNHKMFIIAQGSYHTTDALSSFIGGLQESVKSRPINPKYIDQFYKVCPRTPQNEVWTIGYNGVDSSCGTISGKCSNKYTIRIDVQDEFILRTYNRNLYRYFTVETPCCDECSEECIAADVDPKWIADELVKKINKDPEISQFVFAEVLLESAINHDDDELITYNVTITDAGNAGALTDVVTFYSDTLENPTRLSYATGVSIYEVILPASADAPTLADDIDGAGLNPDAVEATGEFLPIRTLCVTLAQSTGVDNETEFTSFLSGRTDIVAGSIVITAGTSADSITFKQYATETVIETADTRPSGEFEIIPSYNQYDIDGNLLNVVTIGECPCPTAPTAYTDAVGIKLTASFRETKFGTCSFHPRDSYTIQPIRIYVDLVDDAELCTDKHTKWSTTQLQVGSQASGLGETVLRQYLLNMGYKQEYYEYEPRWREVMDQQHLNVIDKDKYYVLYYLSHYIPNSFSKGMSVTSYDEKYVLCFPFEETDTAGMTAFEAAFVGTNKLLSQSEISTTPGGGLSASDFTDEHTYHCPEA
jgi:hypothetical protein